MDERTVKRQGVRRKPPKRKWRRKRKPLSEAQRRVLATATPRERDDAKRFLARHGQGVTPGAIAAEIVHARERLKLANWAAATRRDVDVIGQRAASLVQLALDKVGRAPTWAELAKAMGWRHTQRQMEWAVPFLEEQGWLVTGPEPRSLRPGPKLRGR